MAFLFIGARREDVEFVAEMLRKNLDQESVLITAEPIEYYYLFNQDASERAGAFAAFGATISAPEGAPLALPVSELAAKSFDGLENAYDQFDVALKIINATIVSERRNENDGEAENDGETETETESKLDSIGVRMTSENIGSTLQYEPVDCFTIYIGLEQRRTISDEEAKKQAARTIVNILRQRAIAYSLNVVYGGYEFEDGFFEQESLQITLIGASEDDVCTIASELCKNTNQDVALVTRGGLQSTYLTVN